MALGSEEMINRLRAISILDGVVYGRARLLLAEEKRHSEATLQYKGYLAVSDAFKCLFLESVELINIECMPKVKTPLSEFYALFVPRLAHNFLSLCGAERVAIQGYPYHGYTLLRNIFDNLILTAAALQRITDFYSILGIDPKKDLEKDLDPNAIKKLAKQTEYAARRRMTGDQSGLSESTVRELTKWDALFDFETHGARLSLTHAADWMKSKALLPVLPKFDERAFAMFMNRFCEVGWMVNRLIPLIQPPKVPLPDPWREKWQFIDESFEELVDSLTKQRGKEIGTAIVEFVKAKFPFNGQSVFPL